MLVITKLIMIGIAVVCAVTLTFIVLEFVEDKVISKFSKKRNRVHFYVVRDDSGRLWLYISKPIRAALGFIPNINGRLLALEGEFSKYGLDENDYVNLKWEDEPIEVFVNMED